MQLQEAQKLAEERKREKMEERLARQKVKEQIAKDKAERAAKGKTQAPVSPQPVAVPKKEYDTCRLQVRGGA